MSGAGEVAPLIVTALLGAADLAWADALRRAHFPPERNRLRAHLTLFHHLPPSAHDELAGLLRDLAREGVPTARLSAILSLGRGVAFAVESAGLHAIRAAIADRFDLLLTPQDRVPWRPHITVQNKVHPALALSLLEDLRRDFVPRPLVLAGLALWHYRGGPWQSAGAWAFGTGHRIATPN